MALQAKHVHVVDFKHARIGRTMRRVAGRAAFHFYRRVLIDIGPLLVGVALEAGGVLCRRHPHLLRERRSVDVVAIRAIDQGLVHSVVERHGKLRLLLQMAAKAQFWLGFGKLKLGSRGVMDRMAGNATYAVLPVNRIDCMGVLGPSRVAGKAPVVNFLSRVIFEDEDLADVAAARDVRRAGPMAPFASLM